MEHLERRQVSLKLSLAMAIHLFQGLTLPRTVIDLRPSGNIADLVYLELPTLRKLSNLMLQSTSYERLGV